MNQRYFPRVVNVTNLVKSMLWIPLNELPSVHSQFSFLSTLHVKINAFYELIRVIFFHTEAVNEHRLFKFVCSFKPRWVFVVALVQPNCFSGLIEALVEFGSTEKLIWALEWVHKIAKIFQTQNKKISVREQLYFILNKPLLSVWFLFFFFRIQMENVCMSIVYTK